MSTINTGVKSIFLLFLLFILSSFKEEENYSELDYCIQESEKILSTPVIVYQNTKKNKNVINKRSQLEALKNRCSVNGIYHLSLFKLFYSFDDFEGAQQTLNLLRRTGRSSIKLETQMSQMHISRGDFRNLEQISKSLIQENSLEGNRLQMYHHLHNGNLEDAEKTLYLYSLGWIMKNDPVNDRSKVDYESLAASDIFFYKRDYYNSVFFYKLAMTDMNLESILLASQYTSCNAIESFLKLETKCDICWARKILVNQAFLDEVREKTLGAQIEKYPGYHKVKKMYDEIVKKPENRIIEEDIGYCASIIEKCK